MSYGASLGRMALLALFAAGFAAQPRAQPDGRLPISCEAIDAVGAATMSADGVLTLRLRAMAFDSIPAREELYAPGDSLYDEATRHLGGIAPGQSKPVPPLCGLNSEP